MWRGGALPIRVVIVRRRWRRVPRRAGSGGRGTRHGARFTEDTDCVAFVDDGGGGGEGGEGNTLHHHTLERRRSVRRKHSGV